MNIKEESLWLRPSSAYRWSVCTGSAYYDMTMESKSSPAAERGTMLHEESERRLDGGRPKELDPDDEHIVRQYVNYVNRAFGNDSKRYSSAELHLEKPVAFSSVCGGTPDAVITTDGSIRVIDLKTGMRPVSAHGNKQLLIYLAAAVKHYSIDPYKCRMTIEIVQPTSGTGGDKCEVSVEELHDFRVALGDSISAVLLCNDSEAWEFEPSYDACHFCNGKAVCKARREDVLDLFESEVEKSLEQTDLAKVLDQADQVESWLGAVREYALERAIDGAEIEGFFLGTSVTQRKWDDPQEVEDRLMGLGYERDSVLKQTLQTPAAIERMLMPEEWESVQELVIKPAGKPVLKRSK